MIVGIIAILLMLVIVYFIREASRDQHLDHNYSIHYTPFVATLETWRDVSVPVNTVWNALMDFQNYPLWIPYAHRLRVANDTTRYVHKHSLQHFKIEQGKQFKIRPFLFAPYTTCRFTSIESNKTLTLEMRFFPFNKESITISLKPYSNCTELVYASISKGLFSFISTWMFSWRGKNILYNLADLLPDVPMEKKPVSDDALKDVKIVMDQDFINAIVVKAMTDGVDILNSISDKKHRAMAKSGLVKAQRSGKAPVYTPEAMDKVERFLKGEKGSPLPIPEAKPALQVSQEVLINQYVLKALAGEDDLISAIDNKILRAKVKSAVVKAKRSGIVPEIPEGTPPIGETPTSAKQPPVEAKETTTETPEEIIETAVQKALEGDLEPLNSISNKILRAKAKSAFVKAKRKQK